MITTERNRVYTGRNSWRDTIDFELEHNGEYIFVKVVCEMSYSKPEPDVNWAGGVEMDDYYCEDERYNDALWACDESEVWETWAAHDERWYN